MKDAIKISKLRGDDGHRIISVRIREGTLKRIDDIARVTNRSRNDLINLLLENALEIVEIEE